MKFLISILLCTCFFSAIKAQSQTNTFNAPSVDSTKVVNAPTKDVKKLVTRINSTRTGAPAILNVSPNVIKVLNKPFTTTKTAEGFRIQIYSSNRGPIAKKTAFEIEKTIKETDPNIGIYISYESPFWKVRLGNCASRDEATKFRLQIIEKFPDFAAETYIVPSEIEVN